MSITPEQRRRVSKNVEHTVVTSVQQINLRGDHLVHMGACISLAFSLGVRFGLAFPYQAGDFMGRWTNDHTIEGIDAKTLAERNQRAMISAVQPLMGEYTDDD